MFTVELNGEGFSDTGISLGWRTKLLADLGEYAADALLLPGVSSFQVYDAKGNHRSFLRIHAPEGVGLKIKVQLESKGYLVQYVQIR